MPKSRQDIKAKKQSPRRRQELTFNLTVNDGTTPIVKIKEQKFKNLNDVLEMLNRKL